MSGSSVTPWTVAHQVPLSMGFPRQGYWSGLPFPSPGDRPDSGIESTSPALAGNGTQPPSMGQHSNLHTLVLGAWPQRTQKSASRKGLLGFRSLRKLPRVEGLLLSLCNRQICLYIVKQPSHAVVTGVTLLWQRRLPRCPELESQQERVSQCVCV